MPSSLAPNLDPIVKSQIIEEIKRAGINQKGIDDLIAEGFPESMTLAFLNTAKETNAIVSTRLPGGVGTALIEEGYDLKGFQVKAKSCNWGPMAGFICQLPFFNKSGYDKISYNTKYLTDYLSALARFNKPKGEIARLKTAQDSVRTGLLLILVPTLDTKRKVYDKLEEVKTVIRASDKKINIDKLTADMTNVVNNILRKSAIDAYVSIAENTAKARNASLDNAFVAKIARDYIFDVAWKLFDTNIVSVVTAYKEVELREGEWSGENTHPGGTAFVPLVRKYTKEDGTTETAPDVAKKLKNMRGVIDVKNSPDSNTIMGTAYDKGESAATIKVNFILHRDSSESSLWSIYHGDISYRDTSTKAWIPYIFIIYKKNDDLLEYFKIKAAEYGQKRIDNLNIIFSQNKDKSIDINKETYYPLCGVLNPHPPYPEKIIVAGMNVDNPEFYKNAVSGDYDLFAVWPSVKIPNSDLTRASEIYLNQNLKVAYPNRLFCFDFIPGFSELTQKEDTNQKLKESAETGNINYLGELVSQMLNSQAMLLDIRLKGNKAVAVNKAFHSDEGGRPGVMEIDFPIAIFFPEKITSTVLKSGDTPETSGGLIQNIQDFLQLLIEINFSTDQSPRDYKLNANTYKIIVHSEWMMHMFYLALSEVEREVLWPSDKLALLYATDSTGATKALSKELPEARKKAIDDRIKEFKTIGNNPCNKQINGFKPDNFKALLRKVLGGKMGSNGIEPMDDVTFDALQAKFLEFAFQGNKKAIVKRMEIETIVYKKYIDLPL